MVYSKIQVVQLNVIKTMECNTGILQVLSNWMTEINTETLANRTKLLSSHIFID